MNWIENMKHVEIFQSCKTRNIIYLMSVEKRFIEISNSIEKFMNEISF